MKKAFLLFVLCICILFLAGCQETAKKEKLTEPNIVSKSNFPNIMVGVWEADVNDGQGSKWGIKFEPDGSINKIIHSVAGTIDLREGVTYEEGPDEGTFVYFIMGPCTSKYDSHKKIIKVKIVVEEYMMKLPTGELRGKIEDVLEGPISKDGKTWNAEWRDYGQLEGADLPDYNEIDANPEKLVFRKLDLEKLKSESEEEPNSL